MARAQRLKLEMDLRETQLIGRSKKEFEKNAHFVVNAILVLEEPRIPAATRLDQKSVKGVELKVKGKRHKQKK